MSLDSGFESDGVGADDLADLLAVLEEEESGHGAHAVLLGDLGDLVDVDLVEAGVGVGVGEPGKRSVLLVCPSWRIARISVSMLGVFVRGSFWADGLICNRAGLLGQAWARMGRNVLDDLRSDDLAGTAPGGEEVNDHEALLAESGVEVGLAVNRAESVCCPFRAQG